MKSKIHLAQSKIHLSYDLWTSPNSLAILRVIAHYIDKDGTLQYTNLALKSIIGEHTGEQLAAAIIEVLEDWGFALKLGFIVSDNAPSNDVMMRTLQRGKRHLFKLFRVLLIILLCLELLKS